MDSGVAVSVAAPLPSVTCVVTAHNHAAFVDDAVRSVLMQDYPRELLSVLVVNDGSTDGTAEVLTASFGAEQRVALINQQNQGFVSATNVALGNARSDLVAILDGDDAWKPGRLRRQVEILTARPDVGLVHGDMELVDGAGRTLNPSYFGYSRFRVPRGRVLAKLIHGPNFVTSSAIVFRAEFLRDLYPVPPEAIYPDWHFATRVAQTAEIDFPEGAVSVYRMHASNMGLGGTGLKFFEDMRNNVRIQRWMLLTLALNGESLTELRAVTVKMRGDADLAAYRLGVDVAEILPVSDGDREAAADEVRLASALIAAGETGEAGTALVRAAAHDPWDLQIAATLESCANAVTTGRVDIPTRGAAILAFAEEIVAHPEMLDEYGSVVTGEEDVTLLLWAAFETAELVEAVSELVSACGMGSDAAADILLHCSPNLAHTLSAPVVALYTRNTLPRALARLPRIDRVSPGLVQTWVGA
jgi:glycosyltransferase involved in cell wall biosynthesis